VVGRFEPILKLTCLVIHSVLVSSIIEMHYNTLLIIHVRAS